jgi:long-chain fatty acid transport protein
MTLLDRPEMAAALGISLPSTSFSNAGSVDGTGGTLGGNTEVRNKAATIPGGYLLWPLGPDWRLGLAVTTPFGQGTHYDAGWVGRYQTIDSELRTVDIGPSVAWRARDWLSLGAGLDIQYARAKRSHAIDFGTICFGTVGPASCAGAGLLPQSADGHARVDLDSWGYGYNVGALLRPASGIRVGLAYRSAIRHEFEGDSDVTAPASAAPVTASGGFDDTTARANVTFPESVALGVSFDVGQRWTLLGEILWTHWSRFERLTLDFANPLQTDTTQEQDRRDTFRFSAGAIYALTASLSVQAGAAFSESPAPDATRAPDLPDAPRWMFGAGLRFAVTPDIILQGSYNLLWNRDVSVAHSAPAAGTVRGSFDGSAQGIGFQVIGRF